jgi:hypothetical protein
MDENIRLRARVNFWIDICGGLRSPLQVGGRWRLCARLGRGIFEVFHPRGEREGFVVEGDEGVEVVGSRMGGTSSRTRAICLVRFFSTMGAVGPT